MTTFITLIKYTIHVCLVHRLEPTTDAYTVRCPYCGGQMQLRQPADSGTAAERVRKIS